MIPPRILSTEKIKLIAFDADDTLWVNEPMFVDVQQKMIALLSVHVDADTITRRFYETQIRNLKFFGYGAKAFTLSMIETALELTHNEVTGAEIQQIMDIGRSLMGFPIERLDGVDEVLDYLTPRYDLMVLTKGDLFDQESKIARSGLGHYFRHVEIVSEKDEATYERIIRRYGLQPDEFLMIGNSLKSDVLPVLHVGGQAIHIPYEITWAHEQVSESKLEGKSYLTLSGIRELMSVIPVLQPGQKSETRVAKATASGR